MNSSLSFSSLLNTTNSFTADGRVIPAQSNLGIAVYQMGRDENLFREPLRFYPERFESDQIDPFAFIAWSHGPRDCIGKRFSIYEIKTVLVMLLRNFEIRKSPIEPVVLAQVVLRSKNGFHVKLKRRRT